MKKKRKYYPESFKREAVEQMRSAPSISALAEELRLHENLLYRWRREFEDAMTHAESSDPELEIARLRKELAKVTEERDFLQQAAIFFAKKTQ
ncbi:MAG: transposase [Myxococcales bacterium]|nr:transposase [Myxococcales bacterium]